MSDTDETKRPAKTLSLKKTETSTVKQSFSHGRTKAVVVEKKRSAAPPAVAAKPVAKPAEKPVEKPVAKAPDEKWDHVCIILLREPELFAVPQRVANAKVWNAMQARAHRLNLPRIEQHQNGRVFTLQLLKGAVNLVALTRVRRCPPQREQ